MMLKRSQRILVILKFTTGHFLLTTIAVLLAEQFLRREAKVNRYLDALVENIFEITQTELEETKIATIRAMYEFMRTNVHTEVPQINDP